ncbi:MAG: hypothetical protein HYU28_12025 [Actinobacteria bacterium]|nr:hypothetical protein [Actinomycetota bacterium]
MPGDEDRSESAPPVRREDRERRRRRARLVLLLTVVLGTLLLGLDNAHDVRLEWLVGESDVRLVWVIAVAFAAGAVFERAYSFVRGRRRED